MATKSLTVSVRETKANPCPCGCAPCEGTCCHLDCIVRPRFFCGQLLTDQDLSALLGYARDRFALSRYRDGWGVVCGLDVRCDPLNHSRVVVTPGYAVSCCGDDIIVCEEAALDLSGACREEADPCADLRKLLGDKGGAHDTRLGGFADNIGGGPAAHEGDSEVQTRFVDIFLRYSERASEPATALGRSSCRETSECEYSRTQESYTLVWELGTRGGDPMEAAARRWHEGYERCLDVLVKFRQRFAQNPNGRDVRRWLLDWIERHPLGQFCMLRDLICRMTDDHLGIETLLVPILFQLVQDCRNAYLNCGCFACEAGEGVPLARVWLGAHEKQGRESCHVLWIDPYPPYRRPLSPACWPVPLGQVNVGRVIWHRWPEACTTLGDLGVHVEREEFVLPAKLADLEQVLQCDLFMKCGEERAALVYKDGLFGERVIGFCAGTTQPPQLETLNLLLEKEGPEAARPGEQVRYRFIVTNKSNVPVTVDIEDDQIGKVVSGDVVGAGSSDDFTGTFSVPDGARDSITNTAKLFARAADGRTAGATASHTLKISGDQPQPPDGRRDDFKDIEHIGPKRAEALHEANINTFAELAATPLDRLREIFQGDAREDVLKKWIQEAKRLARL